MEGQEGLTTIRSAGPYFYGVSICAVFVFEKAAEIADKLNCISSVAAVDFAVAGVKISKFAALFAFVQNVSAAGYDQLVSGHYVLERLAGSGIDNVKL